LRADVDVVKALLLVLFTAACGGGGLQAQQSLGPGEARPSKELCIVAVVNYDRVEALVMRGPGGGRVSENRALDRQRRVDECKSQMTASEASCMADARSLTDAQACAPTITW